MVETLPIIMFLLFGFVLPVDLNETVMALVNVCPKNKHDVVEASRKLGCGNDTFGNNQYLCVPNKEKSSLVEFCFQGTMGIVDKGYCPEFSEGKMMLQSCIQFSDGCPEKPYYDYELYRYPACQNISTKFRCYVLDRFCTAQSNTEESSYQTSIFYIMLGCEIISCCIMIIIQYYRSRKCTTDIESTSDNVYKTSGDKSSNDNQNKGPDEPNPVSKGRTDIESTSDNALKTPGDKSSNDNQNKGPDEPNPVSKENTKTSHQSEMGKQSIIKFKQVVKELEDLQMNKNSGSSCLELDN